MNKLSALERILGTHNGVVEHAGVPFRYGGGVDLYHFANGIKGTGFATMEVIEGDYPIPNKYGTYELVAFTKLDCDYIEHTSDEFGKITYRIWNILSTIADLSREEILNPLDTAELPNAGYPPVCLIFDKYEPDGKQFDFDDEPHNLLLIMEVFEEEMQFARKNGVKTLIEKLKIAGYYPYSDTDRDSVI